MKIGVFDSGLGGLSILKEVLKQLPEYDYMYLGDNARVPYGGRSKELLYQFTTTALKFLFSQNCSLVILACNAATSTSLKRIQHEFLPKNYPDRRVLGVIKPAVEYVAEQSLDRIGVIGTYATVNSNAFVKEIKKMLPNSQVFQQSCPLLVPIIEEGELKWEGLGLILKKYLQPLIDKKINSLILGCTHYGLIKDKIQSIVGKDIMVICEGKQVADKLQKYFQKHPEIEKKLSKKSQREFFVTDLNERYQKMADWFLGRKNKLNLVSL